MARSKHNIDNKADGALTIALLALYGNVRTANQQTQMSIPSFFGNANLVLATPGAGAPGFATLRPLVAADIPSIPASKINTILTQAFGGLGVDASAIAVNLIFAGPGSGGPAAAAFRALVAADIPGLDASILTSGIVGLVRGGLGVNAASVAANSFFAGPAGASGAPTFRAIAAADLRASEAWLTITTGTVLTAANRNVLIDTTSVSVGAELPTSPPDGTPITATQIGSTFGPNTNIAVLGVNGLGSNKILSPTNNSGIYLSGYRASATVIYRAADSTWYPVGLRRSRVMFHWDLATAGEFLQNGSVAVLGPVLFLGGVIGTARPLAPCGGSSGTTIFGFLKLQTKTIVGADTTIEVQSANSTLSAAVALGAVHQCTIANGSRSGASWVENIQSTSSPGINANSWIVLKAVTNIATAIDGFLEYWTF